ncbi:Palmitoyltransferase [Entamoeba marina]
MEVDLEHPFYLRLHLGNVTSIQKFHIITPIFVILITSIYWFYIIPQYHLLQTTSGLFLFYIGVLLLVVFVYTYIRLLFKTPIIHSNKKCSEIENLKAIERATEAYNNDWHCYDVDYHCRYCYYCSKFVPQRSFHCHECGYCIELKDHHCDFFGFCIGRHNLLLFLSFFLPTLSPIVALQISGLLYIMFTVLFGVVLSGYFIYTASYLFIHKQTQFERMISGKITTSLQKVSIHLNFINNLEFCFSEIIF